MNDTGTRAATGPAAGVGPGSGQAPDTTQRRLLHRLGYFGHFLHVHAGGRSGKQHVLCALQLRGGTMTQRELLEVARISSAALSEVLSKLEGEGLVERSRHEADRRQLTVELTSEGRSRAEEELVRRRGFEQMAFDCLSEAEQQLLCELLERVSRRWHQIEEEERASCRS